MSNAAQDLAQRAVTECAERYGFDALEAIRMLGLENVKMERKSNLDKKRISKPKVRTLKPSFPLPYNGECNADCCSALRQNNGLYTQCPALRKGTGEFCKSCQVLADKSDDGVPEYGTIKQRAAVGIFEYVDPKGRKPVAYAKVMKKYKLSQEQVLEEATKFNITVDESHFIVPETATKRGRPASNKEKTPKEPKGAKGRPKKAKKVLQIEGEDDDLFASLVADANSNDDDDIEMPKKKKSTGKSDAEKEQEKLAKEQEKAAKEQAKLEEKAAEKLAKEQEKAAKEQAKLEEKAAKEAKKEAERLEREAKKKADEEAKALKLKEKEEKAKSKKPAKAEEPKEESEPDVVKKIEFEGKKYLKSKKTGIVYDYAEYVNNGEQVVVGKWNESKNKIDFENDGEESEEEYDM